MPSDRWLKKAEPARNVSQSDVRRIQQEKQARISAVPDLPSESVNQLTSLDNQLTSLDNQLTSEPPISAPSPLVNQLTSPSGLPPSERFYPSRTRRKLKGIRLPADKLEQYENWQHANRKQFPDFQTAVEYAMDWLTSQPVNQLTSPPVNQLTTLINNDLNNLIINDVKAQRALGKYSQVTGKSATANDHAAYIEVAALPIEAIERGLEETKRRADAGGKRVNSFKYALNVIREEAMKIVPPRQESAPTFCDRCRTLGGMYYPDPSDQSKGLAKCRHDGV